MAAAGNLYTGERKTGSISSDVPYLQGSMAGSAFVDKTLTKSGAAADAKEVGERLAAVDNKVAATVNQALNDAKNTGKFDGEDGVDVTHEWDGTILRVTSASGTSEADLKGERGERGEKGDKGDKGDTGESGIVAPVSGFFSLAVDSDGNLWAYSVDGNVPAFEYDAETGNLYVAQEVE